MKLFPVVSVLVATAAFTLGQLIEIGAPAAGLSYTEDGTSLLKLSRLPISCIEVGIALSLANCNHGVCPQPDQGLGDVLYAGPWKPTPHAPGGFYQNFTLQVPEYIGTGPSIFIVTHLCLLGAGPFPLLQFLNVSVTIEDAPKAMVTESQTVLM